MLIISKIDDAYLEAYKKQKSLPNGNIFDFCESTSIHTITFDEALHRVKKLCDLKSQTSLITKLEQLNKIRNALTHAELNIDDKTIADLFQSLQNDLDILFYKSIGPNYKTVTGYSDLLKKYDAYMQYLSAHDMHLKKETTEIFRKAIEEVGLSIGEQEVARITDIAKAKQFITIINNSNLQFGMDMFDYSCSGNTEMKILDDTYFSLWTLDNKADFRFKFKSLILYVPEITKNASPIIIFESDNDKVESKYEKFLCNDEVSGKYLEGLCFTNIPEPRETFDGQEIDDFYYRCDFDESFMIPRHYAIRRYMDRKIFACINVQGLSYWNFKAFLRDLKEKSGHNIEVLLREWK